MTAVSETYAPSSVERSHAIVRSHWERGAAKTWAAKLQIPRASKRDALSVEVLFNSLAGRDLNTYYAYEIYADDREIAFLIRTTSYNDLKALIARAKSLWPNAEFSVLELNDDPANAFEGSDGYLGILEARLREMPLVPIRTASTREGRSTYDDFSRAADPLTNILGLLSTLGPGERSLIQIAISPMPQGWTRFFRGSSQEVQERLKVTPLYLFGQFLFVFSLVGIFLGLILAAPIFLITHKLHYLIYGIVGLSFGVMALILRVRLPMPPDPLIIQQKLASNAFRTRIRIFVAGTYPEHVRAMMEQMTSVFSVYDMPNGNGFVFKRIQNYESPHDFKFARPAYDRLFPSFGAIFFGKRQLPILSANELAMLWHVPTETSYLPKFDYTTSKRVLAPLQRFSDTQGFMVGYANYGAQEHPVYIPKERLLRGNVGLIARTQQGKSNMMAQIAQYIMQSDPDAALIVIDPHRTLAQSIGRIVPPERRSNTIYWDLSNRDYAIGLNIIAYTPQDENENPDKRVLDATAAMREIWMEYWGPRTEDYLRSALLTLYAANKMLYNEHSWRKLCKQVKQWFETNKAYFLEMDYSEWNDKLLYDLKGIAQRVLETPTPVSPLSIEGHRRAREAAEKIVDLFAPYAVRPDLLKLNYLAQSLYEHTALLLNQYENQADNLIEQTYRSRLVAQDAQGELYPHQYTLLDVPAILSIPNFTRSVLSLLNSPAYLNLNNWWQRNFFDLLQINNLRALQEYTASVINKLNSFAVWEIARRVFGQTESTLPLRQIVEKGGVLIVDLAAGVSGTDVAAIVGATVINWAAYIAFNRQRYYTGERKGPDRNLYIIVDEFHSVPGANYALLLSELNKYGAYIVMGTQSLSTIAALESQHKRNQRIPWLENIHTLFVFACGGDDAKALVQELNLNAGDDQITPQDIVGLPEYHAFVRAREASGTPRSFMVRTLRISPGDDLTLENIIQASLRNYARPSALADVMARVTQEFHSYAIRRTIAEMTVNGSTSKETPTQPQSVQPTGDPFFSVSAQKRRGGGGGGKADDK